MGKSEVFADTGQISLVAITPLLVGRPAKLREVQRNLDISDGDLV